MLEKSTQELIDVIRDSLIAGNHDLSEFILLVEVSRRLEEKNEKLEERITTIEAILNID